MSRIFVGHRALGFVSNEVPLVTRYIEKRKEHLIITCVGRTFHTYGGNKLGLLSVSKIHPADIDCLACDAFLVFSAARNVMYAFRRGTELKHKYKLGPESSRVKLMMPFGPHLIAIDRNNCLRIFDIKSEELVLEMLFPKGSFSVSAILHPATYLNKILLGSKQGQLQLWNVKTAKKIHKFQGWGSGVTCMEQAPALDVVAIGLESGEIFVQNIKFDETIMKFSLEDWGRVTAITFKTELGATPTMVTASASGHLAIWDLEKKKLSAEMRNAHESAIAGAVCLHGEALMVTNGNDNALRQWVFDLSDGSGRLLRLREGHAEPPTKIRFYNQTDVLSAGEDSSLRSFSTVTDLLNKSFGVASSNRKLMKKKNKKESAHLKMRPIVDFSSDATRDKDWDNIVAVHRDTREATTWSFGHQRMGRLKLNAEESNSKAVCVELSICGNFAFVGFDSGKIEKFNVQSGIRRGKCKHPAGRNIRGIQTDGLNQVVMSGDSKGSIAFWNFSDLKRLHLVDVESPVTQMELQRDSGLLALALQKDFSLVVMDILTWTIARRFKGHENQITDLSWTADGRWIVSTSLDAVVKVWDVPGSRLVDHFRFENPATSLTISPNMDFMATSHADDRAIYLWTNLTLYKKIHLRPVDENVEKPRLIEMPLNTTSGIEEAADAETEDEEMEEEVQERSQIEKLLTLAQLPGSRWKNLLDLDTIKKRNKPKIDEVEKPKNAPFFLPTISGLEPKFDVRPEAETEDENGSKIRTIGDLSSLSGLAKDLLKAETSQDYEEVIKRLEEKGPSGLEIELMDMSQSFEVMQQFLRMCLFVLESRTHFEAVESYLALFIKLHSEIILESRELCDVLKDVSRVHEDAENDLIGLLTSSSTLLDFYKNNAL